MTFQIPDYIDLQVVHDEAVLLDTRRDIFLALNATATVVWRAIAAGGTDEDAADELVQRFGIDPTTARADVSLLLTDLVERGLLLTAAP